MHKKHAIGWALGLACLSPLVLAAPGEYWEMTNKVEMQGMSMPGMTNKICIPKGSEKDPRSTADKDCQLSDLKVSGNHTSWKVRCDKNGEVMTGTGDMTATPDRTEGTMTFNSAKTGNMTMSFVNKRIGGACDSDEMKKKFEAQSAAVNQEVQKSCEGATNGREWFYRAPLIVSPGSACAAKKEQLCDVMKRDSGRDVELYFLLKKSDTSNVAKSCGISLDTARKSLCKSVDANNADFAKQMRSGNVRSQYTQSLRAECPAEMKVYAEVSRKRYCEGRGFTEQKRVSLADCLKGVSGDDEAMQTPDPDEPPAGKAATGEKDSQGKSGTLLDGLKVPSLPGGGNAGDAVIDGAKKLKNLFGF